MLQHKFNTEATVHSPPPGPTLLFSLPTYLVNKTIKAYLENNGDMSKIICFLFISSQTLPIRNHCHPIPSLLCCKLEADDLLSWKSLHIFTFTKVCTVAFQNNCTSLCSPRNVWKLLFFYILINNSHWQIFKFWPIKFWSLNMTFTFLQAQLCVGVFVTLL